MDAVRPLILAIFIFFPQIAQTQSLHTENFVSKIKSVDTADKNITFVYLENGRVLRLKSPDLLQDLEKFRFLLVTNQAADFEIRDHGEFDEIEIFEAMPVDSSRISAREPPAIQSDNLTQTPIEPTPDGIYKYMKGMNLKKGSQCFHRAYLWAFDTSTKQNLFTEKAFLFFTPKYIRQYRYKWWFHVAPLLRNPLAPDQDRMIDPWFLTGPRPIQRWTDEFMKNKAVCPVIPVYVAHDQHYADGWCYMRITPMYYYHPNTVALADLEGRIETEFEERGLKYSEAAARR